MDNPPKKKSQPKLAPYLSLSTNKTNNKTNNKHITTKGSTEKKHIKRPMNNLTFMIIYDQCLVLVHNNILDHFTFVCFKKSVGFGSL